MKPKKNKVYLMHNDRIAKINNVLENDAIDVTFVELPSGSETNSIVFIENFHPQKAIPAAIFKRVMDIKIWKCEMLNLLLDSLRYGQIEAGRIWAMEYAIKHKICKQNRSIKRTKKSDTDMP